ncbi:uncharacterized protein LOC112082880 [Eutrema salsugineum]|uniref:uncharacterized protein LOC112082880 n=1 Tax=Eutrema salsugineum TaxID=72664 RepID=UPI000CECED6F|nr:uncharacterized protein LOC112082880 [Eutrema salsugineum]
MKKVGFTYRLIPSDEDFAKFAVKYNILLLATLISLWAMVLGRSGKPDVIDLENFEISEVTFRETMGLLAALMGFSYWRESYQFVFGLFPHEYVRILGNHLSTGFSSDCSLGSPIRQAFPVWKRKRISSVEMKLKMKIWVFRVFMVL